MILDTIAKKTENRVEMLKEEMPLEKIKEKFKKDKTKDSSLDTKA